MALFNTILFGLDNTDTDHLILSYVNENNHLLKDSYPYFVHISPSLAVPELANAAYTAEPKDELLTKQLKQSVEKSLADVYEEKQFSILEGNITQQILHWENVKQADLIILGRKDIQKGSHISPKRILRHAKSSVLFIPEGEIKAQNRVLVLSDFSEASMAALEKAIVLAKLNPEIKHIDLLNIYEYPYEIQYQTLHSPIHLKKQARKRAENTAEEFLQKVDTQGVEIHKHFIENNQFNIARHVMDFCFEKNPDLIMMGAKGHSALSSFLIGSVAESMCEIHPPFPLLIVRP